jgi:hypothetical protein
MTKKIFLPLLLLAALVAGCGNDAEVESRDAGNAKAIINMPDKFPNVSHKCYGPNGIYVTNNTETGSGSPAVVLDDPQCGAATSETTP